MPKTKPNKRAKAQTKPRPGEQVLRFALGSLDPSKTNRPNRSGFDAKSIRELADSIVGPGIIEPLIIRLKPDGRHEVVCGERRLTAAKLLKLETVPCIVRDLDDAAARKVQIIENLQREGLHPVEEAQGYADLLAQVDAAGKPVNTIDSIHKDIGKSAAFVYGRIKLLEMPKVALDASLSGKLTASVALLIARIPDPKLARKAALEVLSPHATGDDDKREQFALDPEQEAMSYRSAKEHIQANYMKRIRGAKFDPEDADLVPIEQSPSGERRCGGACSDCPWRTGNLTLLLPGEAQDRFRADWQPIATDVCTNPACFKRKTEAAWRLANVKAKSQGHTLLRDGKAAQIFQSDGQLQSSEFVDLRAVFPGEKKKTWEQVLGEKLPDQLVQARDSKRKVHFLIERTVAADAAKLVGRTLPKSFKNDGNGSGHGPTQEDREKEEAAKVAKRALNAPIALALFRQLLAKAEAEPNAHWWRWIVTAAIAGAEDDWAELLGHKDEKALIEWIEKAKVEPLRALLLVAVAVGHNGYNDTYVSYQGDIDTNLLAACEFVGIDHKAFIDKQQALVRVVAKADIERGKLKAANEAEAAKTIKTTPAPATPAPVK